MLANQGVFRLLGVWVLLCLKLVVILFLHLYLAIEVLVLNPPQVLGQVIALDGLLHTVDVVSLQEPRLGAVYVP